MNTLSRKTYRSGLAALVLAGLAIAATSEVQADTTWNTRYRSLGGQVFDAVLVLDSSGRFGSYTTYDSFGNFIGRGSVDNVQFQNLGGQSLLRGTWRWNAGGSGNFTWRLNPTLDNFNGNYSANGGGGGFWNGRYQNGNGAIGQGGPVR